MIDWLLILELFWTFFKIGLFTFGGGYAMIPLIRDEVVTKGWLVEQEVVQFIAISESTPGPFAINMATFVGTSQAGVLGGIVSTIGVILPSFIIILIIAKYFHHFATNKYVSRAMKGIQPIVVALIAAAAVLLIFKNVFPAFPALNKGIDLRMLTLTINAALLYFGYRYIRKKSMSPIALILISAFFGIIVFH